MADPVPRAEGRNRALSVVVPVYDELESLPALHEELARVLSGFPGSEVVYVDDGSTDGSGTWLERLVSGASPGVGAEVTVVELHRNYGKSEALAEGLRRTRREIVVTLDADLQDDPAEIPRLLEKLDEGYDLVAGWKRERHDPVGKRWPSRIFNAVTRAATGVAIHDFNSGIKVFRRELARSLDLYGGRHRYIPALAGQKRFRVGEIEVHHRPRIHGHSKFGTARFLHGFFDLVSILFLDRYLQRPLHLFGSIGLGLSALGVGAEAWVLYLKYLRGEAFARHMAMLVFGVLLILVGIQLVSLGLLGELVAQASSGTAQRVRRVVRASSAGDE